MSTLDARDLVKVMDRIAPLELAEPWDNVGQLAGDEAAPITRVLLTIDCTNEVLQEAALELIDAVVAYHPPIFAPLKRVVGPSVVAKIAQMGIVVYSPHTALDCALGGTNDALADAVGMKDRSPLIPRATKSKAAPTVKLVTFVPEANVDAVAEALFARGAGRIGAYSKCSFRSAGTGTFFGGESARPAVGAALRHERVAEIRLEVLLATATLPEAIAALRQAHPYEEPAIDLVPLAPPPEPDAGIGMGRIGDVEGNMMSIAERLRTAVGSDGLLIAGPSGRANDRVTRVAVLAGSAGELLTAAIDRGAELIVTGEVRHHDALAAVARGASIICTLHSNSERLVLPALQARLAAALPGVDVMISAADRDPFRVMTAASLSSSSS